MAVAGARAGRAARKAAAAKKRVNRMRDMGGRIADLARPCNRGSA
jgi:hypothetical protein